MHLTFLSKSPSVSFTTILSARASRSRTFSEALLSLRTNVRMSSMNSVDAILNQNCCGYDVHLAYLMWNSRVVSMFGASSFHLSIKLCVHKQRTGEHEGGFLWSKAISNFLSPLKIDRRDSPVSSSDKFNATWVQSGAGLCGRREAGKVVGATCKYVARKHHVASQNSTKVV